MDTYNGFKVGDLVVNWHWVGVGYYVITSFEEKRYTENDLMYYQKKKEELGLPIPEDIRLGDVYAVLAVMKKLFTAHGIKKDINKYNKRFERCDTKYIRKVKPEEIDEKINRITIQMKEVKEYIIEHN